MVPWEISICLVFIFFAHRCLKYVEALRSIDHHPGLRSFLPKAKTIPGIWSFSPEKTITWVQKHQVFQRYGWDTISSTSMWPFASIAFFVADPGAIKEITSNRSRIPKLMTDYNVLALFGPNIVASEGLEWKKYRRLLAPAFSHENIMTVWEETFKVMHDLHQKWTGVDSVLIEHAPDFSFKISLRVISITGFGIHLQETVPPNHTLSFSDALHRVAMDGFLKIVVPDWVPGITGRVRKFRKAYAEVRKYMEELVNAKQSGSGEFIREGSLLSSIVKAAAAEESEKIHFTHDELFGNLFISFFAGFETTMQTTAFALILLAIHPLEQELVYQQVREVWDGNGIPPWSTKAKLTRALAVLNETLRMFPPVTGVPKYAANPCVVKTCSATSTSEHRTLTIPQGATIIIDVPGLHYNPKYWPEPNVFKPDRFLGSWSEDAFLPFSSGSRACLGRDFSETEIVAVIASLVSKYKIELHPDLAGIDTASLMQRLSDVTPGLTLIPKPFPLVLKKRPSV